MTDQTLETFDETLKTRKLQDKFLILKKKMLRTDEMIKMLTDKRKECEIYQKKLADTHKELEETKKNYNSTLTKKIKLEHQMKEIETSSKDLTTKIEADQSLITQLHNSIKDNEEKFNTKVMEMDLTKAELQCKIKSLRDENKNLQRKLSNDKPKKSTKGIQNIGVICSTQTETAVTCDVSVNTVKSEPKTSDKCILTDKFYDTRKEVFPLFCNKCEYKFQDNPTEKIFATMTNYPAPITAFKPSPPKPKVQEPSKDSQIISYLLKKVDRLDRMTRKSQIKEKSNCCCSKSPQSDIIGILKAVLNVRNEPPPQRRKRKLLNDSFDRRHSKSKRMKRMEWKVESSQDSSQRRRVEQPVRKLTYEEPVDDRQDSDDGNYLQIEAEKNVEETFNSQENEVKKPRRRPAVKEPAKPSGNRKILMSKLRNLKKSCNKPKNLPIPSIRKTIVPEQETLSPPLEKLPKPATKVDPVVVQVKKRVAHIPRNKSKNDFGKNIESSNLQKKKKVQRKKDSISSIMEDIEKAEKDRLESLQNLKSYKMTTPEMNSLKLMFTAMSSTPSTEKIVNESVKRLPITNDEETESVEFNDNGEVIEDELSDSEFGFGKLSNQNVDCDESFNLDVMDNSCFTDNFNVNRNVTEINLNEVKINEVNIEETKINEVNVNKTKINEVNLNETEINEVNRNEMNIDEVNLNKMNIDEVNLNKTKMNEVNLNEMNIDEVNLNKMNIDEVNQNEINIDEVNQNKINTNEVNLEETNINTENVNAPIDEVNINSETDIDEVVKITEEVIYPNCKEAEMEFNIDKTIVESLSDTVEILTDSNENTLDDANDIESLNGDKNTSDEVPLKNETISSDIKSNDTEGIVNNVHLLAIDNVTKYTGNGNQIKSDLVETNQMTSDVKDLPSSPRMLRSRQINIDRTSPGFKKQSRFIDVTKLTLSNSTIISCLNEYVSAPTITEKSRRCLGDVKHQIAKENLIHVQLSRLIEAEPWTSELLFDVAQKILSCAEDRTIAKCIVEYLLELPEDDADVDTSHTPPAPIMTKNQQKLVTLIVHMNKFCKTIMSLIEVGIEYKYFRIGVQNGEREILQGLARMLIVFARINKDRERVRMLCCDAVYRFSTHYVDFLFIAFTCWPEVLPKFSPNNDVLSKTLAFLILTQKTDGGPKNRKYFSLKKMLTTYYEYPVEGHSLLNLLKELMTKLPVNCDPSVNTALILLSKRLGPDESYAKIIQGGLLHMIVQKKHHSMYDALSLLGNIMRAYPLDSPHVANIADQLTEVMAATSVTNEPQDTQEGIASALMSLSRHRFDQVTKALLKWNTTAELRKETKIKLASIFRTHDANWWKQFVQSNFSHPKNSKKLRSTATTAS